MPLTPPNLKCTDAFVEEIESVMRKHYPVIDRGMKTFISDRAKRHLTSWKLQLLDNVKVSIDRFDN